MRLLAEDTDIGSPWQENFRLSYNIGRTRIVFFFNIWSWKFADYWTFSVPQCQIDPSLQQTKRRNIPEGCDAEWIFQNQEMCFPERLFLSVPAHYEPPPEPESTHCQTWAERVKKKLLKEKCSLTVQWGQLSHKNWNIGRKMKNITKVTTDNWASLS